MSMKQSVQRERKGMKKFTKPLCTNDIGIECVGSTDPTKPPKMYLLRYCTVPQTLYVLHHQGLEEPYVVSMTRKEYTELLDYFLFLCPETTKTTVKIPLTEKKKKKFKRLWEELDLPDLSSAFEWELLPRMETSSLVCTPDRFVYQQVLAEC